ncbi:hypothetical protein H2200_004144 [Cladophialophora chaetospira]|uniref:Capsule polysaccharide biosynthesis protein n=1 Tax=Cladophialophora chaetospira TaxID=386627 RepID=A0AA39CLE9_9EURO|nr:hypothetical protein H2200_004144 [Cladophialophora chaetospira]
MAVPQSLIGGNTSFHTASMSNTSSLSSSILLEDISNLNVVAGTLVFLSSVLTWTNFGRALIMVFLLLNLKAFPLVYHLRVLNAIRFVLRSQKPKQDVQPEQLFQPLITSSKACLMEIDVLGHKSNSTYFADVDIARTHLITTLFARGIEKIRGSTTMNGLSKNPPSKLTVALGGVSCTFKKELLAYETYDMWTRILAWDDKWVYIVTHFVKQRRNIRPRVSTLYPQQNTPQLRKQPVASSEKSADDCRDPDFAPSNVVASALSKIVFKNGRITIRPQEMLAAANLIPQPCDDRDDIGTAERKKLVRGIEAERERGLRMANLLGAQVGLHNEFQTDVALGKHYDGFGVEGVVATLAQLGKISPYQLI